MKRTLGLMVLLIGLVGCQQGAKNENQEDFGLVTQASESAMVARASFPRAAASRSALGSANPRSRIIVTWGGGLLSCGKWHLQLSSNKTLYRGATQLFERGDTVGRSADTVVHADTNTCGHKDRGAVSLDYSADATAIIDYSLYNARGTKLVAEGQIEVTPYLKDGGFAPKSLPGGNFINYYVEPY